MKKPIFIPFHVTYKGGVQSFVRNLHQYLDEQKYPCTTDHTQSDLALIPQAHELDVLDDIKSRGGKIIQRVAGGFYPSQHGSNYRNMNYPYAHIYNNYADHVVFQSEYAQWQNFALFGERAPGTYSIIFNGADKQKFFPNPKVRSSNETIKFVSCGSFRKKAMLEPIVKALDSLVGKFKFEYHVIGDILNEDLKSFIDRPYIQYTSALSLSEIAETLRNVDAFLHSQLNDICPNAIVEAVSSGVPVIAFDSGAVKELLYFQPELLAYVSEDLLQREEDFDYKKFAEKLLIFVDNQNKFKELSLAHADDFTFEKCGKAYTNLFNLFN